LPTATGSFVLPPTHYELSPNNTPLKPLHRNLRVKAIISMC